MDVFLRYKTLVSEALEQLESKREQRLREVCLFITAHNISFTYSGTSLIRTLLVPRGMS